MKQKILKLSALLLITCTVFFQTACEKGITSKEVGTLKHIETELGFTNPLSELSRIMIMERYSSLENYRNCLITAYSKLGGKEFKSAEWTRYKVTLIIPDETVPQVIRVSENETILDRAIEEGIDLPYSCKAGACGTCTGHVTHGAVDQSEQCFLSDAEVRRGYCLTCVATPLYDCTILPHQEENLYTNRTY